MTKQTKYYGVIRERTTNEVTMVGEITKSEYEADKSKDFESDYFVKVEQLGVQNYKFYLESDRVGIDHEIVLTLRVPLALALEIFLATLRAKEKLESLNTDWGRN